MTIRSGRRKLALPALAVATALSWASHALAGGAASDSDSFEDKHLFGFTEGSDVGEPGSNEAEFTTSGAFGKQGGGIYQGVAQEAAYETAVTDRFGYEVIGSGVWQTIQGVPGLADRRDANFQGVAFEPKYVFLRRGIDAPVGLSLSLQPEWDRVDDITGGPARNFSMETKLYLDQEFIRRKLLGAINLIYLPEFENDVGAGPSHYALFGATGGLSYLFTPDLYLGGEVEFYRAYESLGFANSSGSAVYVGPTLHLQMGPGAFVSLAWSEAAASPRHLSPAGLAAWNQSDLARQRAHMVFGVEF
ncbi:hypothetical protein [Rhodoblastus sp.]|uniref:hypothetical protein n=1 Tax=Rhodoblastus sp. TaxID=1962975 RepID=UPI003F9A8DB2